MLLTSVSEGRARDLTGGNRARHTTDYSGPGAADEKLVAELASWFDRRLRRSAWHPTHVEAEVCETINQLLVAVQSTTDAVLRLTVPPADEVLSVLGDMVPARDLRGKIGPGLSSENQTE